MPAKHMQQIHGRRHAAPCDVERRAVVDAGAQEGQANGHVHRAVEAEELDGDQALIVKHGEYHVELASAGTHEHGVGR